MKVIHTKKGLIITPETDFEVEYLKKFSAQSDLVVYLKEVWSVGMPKEKKVVGLCVIVDEKKENR
jgi:hypothetical protein